MSSVVSAQKCLPVLSPSGVPSHADWGDLYEQQATVAATVHDLRHQMGKAVASGPLPDGPFWGSHAVRTRRRLRGHYIPSPTASAELTAV